MPNFVGREHELGWLGERLASAGSGHPQTVVVEGPAGIGKSALLGAFAAGLDPAQLLDASGDEDERFLAFGLLQQLTGAPTEPGTTRSSPGPTCCACSTTGRTAPSRSSPSTTPTSPTPRRCGR